MRVTIPACENHDGFSSVTIDISDKCPVCGGPRGVPYKGFSYDGSRKLYVDCWKNPCGHIDKYSDVRKEAENRELPVTVFECDDYQNPIYFAKIGDSICSRYFDTYNEALEYGMFLERETRGTH